MGPRTLLGKAHLLMYTAYDANCSTCHDGVMKPKPPTISMDKADMRSGTACRSCHAPGGRQKTVFVSLMNNPDTIIYNRCSDCHKVTSSGGWRGWQDNGSGWGGSDGGGWGGSGGGWGR
jgi:hypothetical protein